MKDNILLVAKNSISETCNVIDINSWIAEKRRIWNEHISRMDDTRLVKKARDSQPNTKRSIGRPRKRWSDSV